MLRQELQTSMKKTMKMMVQMNAARVRASRACSWEERSLSGSPRFTKRSRGRTGIMRRSARKQVRHRRPSHRRRERRGRCPRTAPPAPHGEGRSHVDEALLLPSRIGDEPPTATRGAGTASPRTQSPARATPHTGAAGGYAPRRRTCLPRVPREMRCAMVGREASGYSRGVVSGLLVGRAGLRRVLIGGGVNERGLVRRCRQTFAAEDASKHGTNDRTNDQPSVRSASSIGRRTEPRAAASCESAMKIAPRDDRIRAEPCAVDGGG